MSAMRNSITSDLKDLHNLVAQVIEEVGTTVGEMYAKLCAEEALDSLPCISGSTKGQARILAGKGRFRSI